MWLFVYTRIHIELLQDTSVRATGYVVGSVWSGICIGTSGKLMVVLSGSLPNMPWPGLTLLAVQSHFFFLYIQ